MPAVEDVLADLATHPPAEPTPVGEIRGRARRRTRRRRAGAGLAAALVLVVVGVGLGAAVTADDPGQDVVADGGTTAGRADPPSTTGAVVDPPSTTAAVPVARGEPTVTLVPASDYVDGTVVEMALDEPAAGPAVVLQCAAEADALDGSPAILPWCTGLVEARAEALEPFTLSRTIATPDGEVDCAEVVGRCTLRVRVGDVESADFRIAPLAFRSDPGVPTDPVVVVDGDEGTVGDGDTLLVTVTGVETDDMITVQQCRTGAAVEVETSARCDLARTRQVVVQDGPETQLTFTAFHDVYVDTDGSQGYVPGWVRCEPCEVVVRVGDTSSATTRLPLQMEPTDDPIRPSITIDPDGPHRWGGAVTVRAAGLQPRDTVPIGWCPVTPPQGGGASACWSGEAELPVEHPVRTDGTVVVEGFVLPGPDSFVGTDCGVAGACGVGIDAQDGAWTLAIAPLDLSG